MATFDELKAAAVAAAKAGDMDQAKSIAAEARALQAAGDKSTFTDIGQGIGAGLVDIVQGITELGALGIDATLDTDYSSTVTKTGEAFKNYAGLLPTGTAGKVAEGIVNYGTLAIPIVGWLGRASQVAKGGKYLASASNWGKTAEAFGKSAPGKALLKSRVGLAGTTSLATGLADVFVSPSTHETISDAFDVLPDFLRTEDLEGMSGRERGFAGLRNKLRIGFEGGAIGASVEAVLPVVGLAAKSAAYIPFVPSAARGLSKAFDAVGAYMASKPFLAKNFTSAGLLPPDFYENLKTVEGLKDNFAADAIRNFSQWEKSARKAVGAQGLFKKNKFGIAGAREDLFSFMTGTIDDAKYAGIYGQKAADAAKSMRLQVDGMTDVLYKQIEGASMDPKEKARLLKEFEAQKGKYMRRLYEMHLDPVKYAGENLTKRPEYKTAVSDIADMLMSQNKKLSPVDAADKARLKIDEIINNRSTSGLGLTPEASAAQVSAALKKGLAGTKEGGQRVPLYRVAESMLKPRSQYLDQLPSLRALMGEVKDPKALYYQTVNDMAGIISSNKLYDSIPVTDIRDAVGKLQANGRPMAISAAGISEEQIGGISKELTSYGYVRLGSEAADTAFGGTYGKLTNTFVPQEMYKALTIPTKTKSFMQEALALSLQAKGLAQMNATVLNPLSQVRNNLSNFFVMLANGNFGRNMDASESFRLVSSNMLDMADPAFKAEADMLRQTGTIGQNLTTNETRALLQEGADLPFSKKVGELATKISEKTKIVPLAQRIYAGSDDFFKIMGYKAEKAKYTAAFRNAGIDPKTIDGFGEVLQQTGIVPRTSEMTQGVDFMDLLSTDIVKATMPTYSRVPEAIKAIRRIPVVGNFVAFPAEVIRTTTNIVGRGLKELSFKMTDDMIKAVQKSNPNFTVQQARALERQVRAIGSQRLSGYMAAAVVVPNGIQSAGNMALGISEDMQEALERLSAPWTKGNKVMFVDNPKDKGGKGSYIDLSYMLPYDFALAPVRAVIQVYSEKGVVSDDEVSNVMAGVRAGLGKLLEPFASESLATERVLDVTVRGGKTSTGAPIYADSETEGSKLAQSFTHVVGGFIPGLVKQFIDVKEGEFVPGRVTRAISGLPGKQGQEYSVAEEAATMATGLRQMDLNLKDNFYYAGAEYSNKRRSANSIFSNRARANDATEASVLEAFRDSNEARYRAMGKLYGDVQAAKKLGLDDFDIRRQLKKDANLGSAEVNKLMNGTFEPVKAGKELIQSVLQETTVKNQARVLKALPLQALNEIRMEYMNKPLVDIPAEVTFGTLKAAAVKAAKAGDMVQAKELAKQARQLQAQEQGQQPQPQPQPQVQAAPQSVPQAAPQQAAPQPAIPTTRPANAPVPSALMGGNPFDQLRNMEIFQRRQGQ